ncbi:MAG: glucose-6-phosphate isomerase, partial [Chlamydiota bacterium]
ECASHFLDLPQVLTEERIKKMVVQNVGWKFFYGCEKVDETVIERLFALADEMGASEKMKKMQEGQICNHIIGFPSDNRSVLHTAMRDFFDHPQPSKKAEEAKKLALEECEKLETFLKKIEKRGFTDLIQIGIGGSELGPKAIYKALSYLSKKKVHFLSNVDPDHAASILRQVDLSKTLVVSVSKSGKTLESFSNEEILREAFKKQSINPKEHIVAVTGKGSPMDDPSKYLSCFYIWDYVGGRFSSSSMCGGVVLGFALGFAYYKKFLEGAHSMDRVACEEKGMKNLPLFGALLSIWNHNFLGFSTEAVVPYSEALKEFTQHLQQCLMESNGKRIDIKGNALDFSTGPILWGEVGTNGQHSFFQLLHQGTDIVPVEFIGFLESQYKADLEVYKTTSQEKLLANLLAQSIALAVGKQNENPNKVFPGNRPSHILFSNSLDPYTLGSLLAYYEHKIAFQGFIWNINSFDQEGVQLGKVLADQVLEGIISKKEKKKIEFSLGKAYLDSL